MVRSSSAVIKIITVLNSILDINREKEKKNGEKEEINEEKTEKSMKRKLIIARRIV